MFSYKSLLITHANHRVGETDNMRVKKKKAIKSKFDFSSQIQNKTNEHLALFISIKSCEGCR